MPRFWPDSRRRRAVPFRRNLLFNLSAGVLVLGGAMLLLSLYAQRKVVEKLSASLTKRVIAATDARLQGFFEPVHAVLDIGVERWRSGEFMNWDFPVLDEYFRPLVERLPQVSSIMLATETGEEYMLLSTSDGWRSRHTRPEEWGSREVWREWGPGGGDPVESTREVEYDARERPWFIGAMRRFEKESEDASVLDAVHWTEPYTFFTTQEPGVTASVAFRTDRGPVAVLAFDVLLSAISGFTSRLRIGEAGKVFVLRGEPSEPNDIVVIGLPADPRFHGDENFVQYILHPPKDLGGPVAEFVSCAFGGETLAGADPVAFTSLGETWWGAAVPASLRTSQDVWIGVVIPESELLLGLPKTSRLVVLVTLAVVGFSVFRSLRLARSYGSSVESLAEASGRMQRLDFEPGEPVHSHIVEIRQLGSTLDRMREVLHGYSSVREDVRISRSIVEMSLPSPLPEPDGFELAAWYDGSDDLTGIAYDAIWIREADLLALASWDVTGSGVRTTVHAAEFRTAFRFGVRQGLSLPDLVRSLETFVDRDLVDALRVRAWVAVLDVRDGILRSHSAGFEPARVFDASEGAVRTLGEALPALGARERTKDIAIDETPLEQGDVVVVASDALVDTLNAERQRFGWAPIERLLIDGKDRALADVVTDVREALRKWQADAGVRSDRSLLALRDRAG